MVTATNSWETRHIEAGTFLTPFDFAHFAIFVLDVNHVCYPVVTATNSWETRHVEAGTFLALFDFAQYVYDVNHAIIPVISASDRRSSIGKIIASMPVTTRVVAQFVVSAHPAQTLHNAMLFAGQQVILIPYTGPKKCTGTRFIVKEPCMKTSGTGGLGDGIEGGGTIFELHFFLEPL